jgi:hypothetical protein
VPLTQFVHIAKQILACGLEFSVEFSTPPEFSGGVTQKYLSTGWAQTIDLQIMNQIFYHCATASLCLKLPWHSLCFLLEFSSRFCSYWQPNFPAVSVVTCWDFPAVSAVTGSQIFLPYL